MKRPLIVAGGALMALEAVLYVVAATALVAIEPGLWFYRLFSAERFISAAILAVVWLGSVFFVGRDIWRNGITAPSFGVFMAWLIVLLYVFRHWFI